MAAQWEPAVYRIQPIGWRGIDRMVGETWELWAVGPCAAMPELLDCYIVTHLPTGMQFGPAWQTTDQAKRFAEAITPLRNDWADVTDATAFPPEFRTAVWSIVSRLEGEAEVAT